MSNGIEKARGPNGTSNRVAKVHKGGQKLPMRLRGERETQEGEGRERTGGDPTLMWDGQPHFSGVVSVYANDWECGRHTRENHKA